MGRVPDTEKGSLTPQSARASVYRGLLQRVSRLQTLIEVHCEAELSRARYEQDEARERVCKITDSGTENRASPRSTYMSRPAIRSARSSMIWRSSLLWGLDFPRAVQDPELPSSGVLNSSSPLHQYSPLI
jgi:hypothetical protein